MTVPTTYQGEARLRRYSDTSTQGQQIVLSLPDRESLAQFIGLEGKRFAVVFVQIGDDEQPVPPEPKPRERLGGLCYQAARLCGESKFQEWSAVEFARPPSDASEERAKQLILNKCRIKSRKDLDHDIVAANCFSAFIVKPFYEWMAKQRDKEWRARQ